MELDQSNHTPLKDYYGKRKRNNDYVAASTSAADQEETPTHHKRMRFDVNDSPASTSTAIAEGNDDNNADAPKHPRSFRDKKNKKFNNNKTAQSSTAPVRFDYSQVDFKKFQGGSHKNKSTANEVSTKFHGKVRETIFLI